MIELFFKHKIDPNNFWTLLNVIELVSSVGIIFASNLLFLQPSNYMDSDVVSNFGLYLFWAFFCVLKCFRINEFFMTRVKYKIIVKSCIDVFPVFKEVLLMYTGTILIYSVVGMFLYGGIMNTDYI